MPPQRSLHHVTSLLSTDNNESCAIAPKADHTMAEASATSMDIDKKPAAEKSGKSNELQLPWVEKYRPKR